MINIGGKDRPVKYNFNAIIEFEELTGIDLAANDDKQMFTKPKFMRALAFVGLKHGAKVEKQEIDFTIDDVGDWLDYNILIKFLDAYVKDNNVGGKQEEPEGEAKK